MDGSQDVREWLLQQGLHVGFGSLDYWHSTRRKREGSLQKAWIRSQVLERMMLGEPTNMSLVTRYEQIGNQRDFSKQRIACKDDRGAFHHEDGVASNGCNGYIDIVVLAWLS